MVVDPWLEGLWGAIIEALSKMASEKTSHLKENAEHSATELPELSTPDVQLNALSITDEQNCEPVKPSPSTDSKCASPPAVGDLRPASLSGGAALEASFTRAAAPKTQPCDEEELASSLTLSLPPLSESSLHVPALSPAYLDVSLQDVDSEEQVMNAAASKSQYFHCTSLCDRSAS